MHTRQRGSAWCSAPLHSGLDAGFSHQLGNPVDRAALAPVLQIPHDAGRAVGLVRDRIAFPNPTQQASILTASFVWRAAQPVVKPAVRD